MDVKKLTSLFKNTKFVLTKINYVPPMFKRTPCLIADSIVWAPEYIEGREGQIFKYQKTNSKDIKIHMFKLKTIEQSLFSIYSHPQYPQWRCIFAQSVCMNFSAHRSGYYLEWL